MDSYKGTNWGRPNNLWHVDVLFYLYFVANATLLDFILKKIVHILLHLFKGHMTSSLKENFLKVWAQKGDGREVREWINNRNINNLILHGFTGLTLVLFRPSKSYKEAIFSINWVPPVC